MTEHEIIAAAADPVFTDEALEGVEEPLADEAPETKRGRRKLRATDPANPSGRLFAPTAEEVAAERRRKHDHQVGLLIGPKNLVKLRAFGFDVSKVSDEPLSSGVAHRGLNE